MSGWQRFRRLEVPFAMPGLLWNTMMSMSGGWFFVVASEAIAEGGQELRDGLDGTRFRCRSFCKQGLGDLHRDDVRPYANPGNSERSPVAMISTAIETRMSPNKRLVTLSPVWPS
jgi:hypothetical protein